MCFHIIENANCNGEISWWQFEPLSRFYTIHSCKSYNATMNIKYVLIINVSESFAG